RRKGADGETDEQHGADAERESADIDLTDQVADADREEDREDRLRPDDFARELNHDNASSSEPTFPAVRRRFSGRDSPRFETARARDRSARARAARYSRACMGDSSRSI